MGEEVRFPAAAVPLHEDDAGAAGPSAGDAGPPRPMLEMGHEARPIEDEPQQGPVSAASGSQQDDTGDLGGLHPGRVEREGERQLIDDDEIVVDGIGGSGESFSRSESATGAALPVDDEPRLLAVGSLSDEEMGGPARGDEILHRTDGIPREEDASALRRDRTARERVVRHELGRRHRQRNDRRSGLAVVQQRQGRDEGRGRHGRGKGGRRRDVIRAGGHTRPDVETRRCMDGSEGEQPEGE